MKFRFTNRELSDKNSDEYISDARLLEILIDERLYDLNQYAPLAKRLNELKQNIK